jgi:hypothetical protein
VKVDPHTQLRHALIDDHLAKGWMDEQMFTAYSVILRQADFETGIWEGSALRLAETCNWSKPKAVRVLRNLVLGRYITSKHIRGVRGNYSVMINNFIPTAGKLKGMKSRRTKTQDYRSAITCDSQAESSLIPYSVMDDPEQDQKVKSPATRVQDVVVGAERQDPLVASLLASEDKNNNTKRVVVDKPQGDKSEGDGLVAGYTSEQIAAHAEACKLNPWVRANDSPTARRREGFVKHLMDIEPPKSAKPTYQQGGHQWLK